MLDTTLNAIKSILITDPSVSPTERQWAVNILKKGSVSEGSTPKARTERLLDRAEAAMRLHVSPRTVDRLAREGTLHRITLPGRKRSAGFREYEVTILIEGAGHEQSK